MEKREGLIRGTHPVQANSHTHPHEEAAIEVSRRPGEARPFCEFFLKLDFCMSDIKNALKLKHKTAHQADFKNAKKIEKSSFFEEILPRKPF